MRFPNVDTTDAAPDSDFDVLVVVRNDRVGAANRVIDIAFDVNLANDLYNLASRGDGIEPA